MTASRAMLTSTLSCLLLGCASPSVQYTKLQPPEKAAPGAQELTSRVVYEQFDGDRFQAASIC